MSYRERIAVSYDDSYDYDDERDDVLDEQEKEDYADDNPIYYDDDDE